MAHVLSVNLAVVRTDPARASAVTGIDKLPADGPVQVRAPGPKGSGLGSGLVGDRVVDGRHHGGDHQAVYAYAREDLDEWAADLGRDLRNGVFGENLTTAGLDVTAAVVGERWLIGDHVVLEVTSPRIPCRTFAAWIAAQRWIGRFTRRAKPGAYLRVIEPGTVSAGDPVTVINRPRHGVTVEVAFRALTREPELLPRLRVADALDPETRALVSRRTAAEASGG